MAAYSVLSLELYSGVWTRDQGGLEQFVHGVTYAEFRSTYDHLWDDGWRLSHLAVCNPAGQTPLFTGYWKKSGGLEIQVYRWNYEDVRAKYDVLWELGWRLKLIEPYQR